MTPLVIPMNHPDPAALTVAWEACAAASDRYARARTLVASYPGNVREYRDAADDLEEAERRFRRLMLGNV
jgi:hypothetical protein